MPKELVLLAIHGMGDTAENFADDLQETLTSHLPTDASDKVLFDSVFYQGVLQPHQRRVLDAMRAHDLDWIKLRRFLLYGLSDAAGLERRASEAGSPYERVQAIIRDTLSRAFSFVGGTKPVILIAHSLGAQVLSNYIWDAQQRRATRGVWRAPETERGSELDDFLRLKSLRCLYTTGCNIPLFVSGFPEDAIKPIRTTGEGYSIRWKNFYDEDDVLGWPLKPLSSAYRNAVHSDRAVNANGTSFASLAASWSPFSHSGYWTDADVVKPLAQDIQGLLP